MGGLLHLLPPAWSGNLDRFVGFYVEVFEWSAVVVLEIGAASWAGGSTGVIAVGLRNAGHGPKSLDRENNVSTPYKKTG